MREARARLEAVLELTADAMLTIDEHGIIDTFNRAVQRMFGLAQSEAVGRNISILMPQPYAADHDAYIEQYLSTGQSRIIGIGRETIGRRRNGSIFPIALAVTESCVDERRLFTGVIRDLSAAAGAEGASEAERPCLELVRENVWQLAVAHNHSVVADRVTISVGVASLREARLGTPRSLVEVADRALYRTKAGGRNRVCVRP